MNLTDQLQMAANNSSAGRALLLLPFIFLSHLHRTRGEICFVEGCICDPTMATASCRDLVLQAIPVMPEWVERLVLVDNHLTELGDNAFRGAKNLKHVILINAELQYLHPNTFKGLEKSLEALDLSHNQLERFPLNVFSRLAKLKSLNLSYNLLSDFDLLHELVTHNHLESLSLEANPLRYSSPTTRLPVVRELNLRQLDHVVQIDEHGITFDNMSDCLMVNCRRLHFDAMYFLNITDLYLGACHAVIQSSFLRQLVSIKRLDLSDNAVQSRDDLKILDRYDQLTFLNVSGLRVPDLTQWQIYPRRVEILDVSRMGLTRLPTQSVPRTNQLRQLWAENNQLSNMLLLQRFDKLTHLSLAGNRLQTLPSVPPNEIIPKLSYLDLSYNHIDLIGHHAFEPYRALRTLILAHNHIKSAAPDAFPIVGDRHFEYVDLSHNELRELHDMVMPYLLTLNLANNQLLTFEPQQFFEAMVSLRELDLSNNDQLFGQVIHNCPNATDLVENYECYPKWVQYANGLTRIQLLNLSNTGLPGLPSDLLMKWPTLKHVDFSNNLIRAEVLDGWFDMYAWPKCILSLNLASNHLKTVGRSSQLLAEAPCLMQLNLSHNPFVCNCKLHQMKRLVLKQPEGDELIHDLRDDTKYYCYNPQNHWQYPLFSYLSVVQPCTTTGTHPGIITLRIVAVLVTLFVSGAFMYVLLCRVFAVRLFKWRQAAHNIQYLYKPLRGAGVVGGSTEQLASPTAL